MRRTLSFIAVCLLALPRIAAAQSQELLLKPGDVVAITGDSITEQRMYSVIMEAYLLAAQPVADTRSIQLGWSGEAATGFLKRVPTAVLPFKPTVATLLFGMNDGLYQPFTERTGTTFRTNLGGALDAMKAGGVRTIIVGTPGAVDLNTFKRADQAVYNNTLIELGKIAQDLATQKGLNFVDVHTLMYDAMVKAKAKYGGTYHLCGPDGFHPAWNGHVVMAYAFLKAMGVSGEIASVEADAGKATTVDGKSTLSITRTDTKYPFCVTGDPADPASTSGVMEFIPFNQDLNRYMLTLKNLGTGTTDVSVTWGKTTKTYTPEAIAKGVNLAADFQDNPFSEPFANVMKAVADKQKFETPFTKVFLINFAAARKGLPGEDGKFDELLGAGMARDAALAKTAKDAVVPVEHTIKIEWTTKS